MTVLTQREGSFFFSFFFLHNTKSRFSANEGIVTRYNLSEFVFVGRVVIPVCVLEDDVNWHLTWLALTLVLILQSERDWTVSFSPDFKHCGDAC